MDPFMEVTTCGNIKFDKMKSIKGNDEEAKDISFYWNKLDSENEDLEGIDKHKESGSILTPCSSLSAM